MDLLCSFNEITAYIFKNNIIKFPTTVSLKKKEIRPVLLEFPVRTPFSAGNVIGVPDNISKSIRLTAKSCIQKL